MPEPHAPLPRPSNPPPPPALPPRKRRVAILGGGAGAMSVAWALSRTQAMRDRFEVTVYQLGWRLGGKGASGRNPEMADRIEEHGLHIWPGFYDNAFEIMREAYGALGRKPGEPLATVNDAFIPQSFTTTQEWADGRWQSWNIDYPTNGLSPGETSPPTWGTYIEMAVQAMIEVVTGPEFLAWLQSLDEPSIKGSSLPDHLVAALGEALATHDPGKHGLPPEAALLSHALELAKHLSSGTFSNIIIEALLALIGLFLKVVGAALAPIMDRSATLRRAFIMIDLTFVQIRGAYDDGVFTHGIGVIDKYDWREWMAKNGASPVTVNSSIVRSMYDYVFGYIDGDKSRPCVSAAVLLNALVRNVFTYRGAVLWKMTAGMGDTVFAPMYLVMKNWGVKFQFFTKVDKLELDAGGTLVERVRMTRQADLAPGVTEYNPLYPVQGLPCWPSHPFYKQLKQGAQLEAEHINLESAWSPWPGVGEQVITRDSDFDDVVLGIAVGALPRICDELIAKSAPFADMVKHVGTVQTQALQLWISKDTTALGWPTRFATVCCGYAQPMDTWADMSQLIPRESWPAGNAPGSIHYFCGPLRNNDPIAPFSDASFPEHQHTRVETNSLTWLQSNVAHLWPRGVAPSDPVALDWSLLVDIRTPPGSGETRLRSQYVRANIDPTERYVLSLPNTAQYRLAPGQSGFGNVFLAGDWTKTPLNAGCVEAAVMSGLAAARAITRESIEILNEQLPWDAPTR